jgi:hypothetical protein
MSLPRSPGRIAIVENPTPKFASHPLLVNERNVTIVIDRRYNRNQTARCVARAKISRC